MDARTWQSAKQLLADVVDLSPAEQRACVEQRCADPELRRQLLQMLDAPAPLSNVVAGALMLAPGTRLGPYEIVARIGGGGMGEVYKARDTRLSRDVAIKILPLHVADDSDRRARFEREAHTISRLNHPHICTLYDVGEQDGVTYLVTSKAGPSNVVDGTYDGDLDAAYDAYEQAVGDAGYNVLFKEKEEDDAEISYEGGGRTGQIALRDACDNGKLAVHITNRPE